MQTYESKVIQKYKCLIQDCELSCCSGWQIAVSKEDVEKWRKTAPQLLRFLNEEKDSAGNISYNMKRDSLKRCSALQDGKCSIQVEYGEDAIPNLCSYFPHVFKKFDNGVFSSATIACPAVVEVILQAKPDDWKCTICEKKYTRNDMADFGYRASGIEFDKLLDLHYKFLSILDNKEYSIDERMALLVNICYTSKGLKAKDLITKFDNFYKIAKENLNLFDNNFHCLNEQYKILDSILYLQQNRNNGDELQAMLDNIERCLYFEDNENKKFNSENVWKSMEQYNIIKSRWENEIKDIVDVYLSNAIKAQLSAYFFPMACYFQDHNDMIVNIAFYYLFLRLVLMCELKNKSSAKSLRNIRRIVSVVARTFYCHSSEKTFNKLSDKGWNIAGTLENAILFY